MKNKLKTKLLRHQFLCGCLLALTGCMGSSPRGKGYQVDTTYVLWAKKFPMNAEGESMSFFVYLDGKRQIGVGGRYGDHTGETGLPDLSGKTVDIRIYPRDPGPGETDEDLVVQSRLTVPPCPKKGQVMQVFRVLGPKHVEVGWWTLDEWYGGKLPPNYHKIP